MGRLAGLAKCCYDSGVELRKFCVKHYKGYAQRAELELAPLTILVGPNNSGKTALAQAIQLFAGGLAPPDGRDATEPLPLESGGIRHGDTFVDLVTGRSPHGRLQVSASMADDADDLSLFASVGNVEAPSRSPARQIADWSLTSGGNEIALQRSGFDDQSEYRVTVSGRPAQPRHVDWRGLIPLLPVDLAYWAEARFDALRSWALGVRHLRCPRSLLPSPFVTPETAPVSFAPDGRSASLFLAADDELRKSVRNWYRAAFGVTIDVAALGGFSELVVGATARDTPIRLTQSGRGLQHVLPVVVMALTAAAAGPGVDVIEHPEAELHPAAHAHVAELLLGNLVGQGRPLVIETHSEMVLLRARRWIAEGWLAADKVVIYWVHTEPGSGSILEKINVDDKGQIENWPDDVFVENYEESMAILRATRIQE